MGSTTTNYAIPYPAVTDYVTDGAQNMEDIAERTDAVLGALSNGRNRLINGDFRIAQRGTSFVAGANNDDTYNLDRWTLLSDGNDIVDVTQANVAPTGGLYSIGLDVETANKKFGILQIIEQRNIVGCYGSQCTLSFKFRTSGSSINNVKAVILSWSSTADSVTSDVVSAWNADNTTPTWATNWTAENTPANLNPTNSWQTASITALVDTASTNNIAVFIWCDDLSTTVGDFLYITDVQFEQGETATKFERRHIQQETALCQRYYWRFTDGGLYSNVGVGVSQGATSGIAWITFPTTMRANPNSLEYSGMRMSDGVTGGSAIASMSLDYASPTRTQIYLTFGAFSAQFRMLFLQKDNSAAHYVAFGAEL